VTERDRPPSSSGLTGIVAACAVIGVAAVGVALYAGPGVGLLNGGGPRVLVTEAPPPTPPGGKPAPLSEAMTMVRKPAPPHATEEYGRRLVAHTAEMLGPDQPDASLRYINSRLNCASCHLGTGTEPGTLTLLQTDEHYPRFSGRAGNVTDIEDRINECMQRSMNGKPLPLDSPEMTAMAAYLRRLGAQYSSMGASLRKAEEPPPFKTPNRAADVAAGQTVYSARCAQCHGADGLGLLATTYRRQGYLFPPLWGPDSFNDGAGMHRVLTAARFIKARMPLGEPTLTDDEAFDVAAFINVQPRPELPNLDQDYPDRSAKPVDNPYGTFADDFPLEQHKLGPFQPIEAYYKKLKETK
jgi:thiosulfate dehydrogenase